MTTNKKLITVIGLELGPAVSLVKVPLAVRSADHGVETMIVISAIKSAESVLALVHLWVELKIAVDIRIDNKVWRLGHHNLIAKHADTKR